MISYYAIQKHNSLYVWRNFQKRAYLSKVCPVLLCCLRVVFAPRANAINNIVDDPVNCRITDGNHRQFGRLNLLLANENSYFKFQIGPSFLWELLTNLVWFNHFGLPSGFLLSLFLEWRQGRCWSHLLARGPATGIRLGGHLIPKNRQR